MYIILLTFVAKSRLLIKILVIAKPSYQIDTTQYLNSIRLNPKRNKFVVCKDAFSSLVCNFVPPMLLL